MLHAPAFSCDFRRAAPPSVEQARANPVEVVAGILDLPDDQLDYLTAKIAFDRLVDSSIDEAAMVAEVERLASEANQLAGFATDGLAKLNALRTVLYKAGQWNGWRPFDYDHSNVRGENVRLKLLSHYLETRLGDCVSMPALFLILADRLGLPVTLSFAPNHLFVKLRLADGRMINLEPTSGGLFARDEWLRTVRPMSDRSVESGMYLRALSKRESIAAMASSVVQYLRDSGRFEETVKVCDLLTAVNPRDGLMHFNKGIACRHLETQLIEKYGREESIPLNLRPHYWLWVTQHREAYARAAALA
jgi:regulator of sirC expression with transglutaminase-like and TPR domain